MPDTGYGVWFNCDEGSSIGEYLAFELYTVSSTIEL